MRTNPIIRTHYSFEMESRKSLFRARQIGVFSLVPQKVSKWSFLTPKTDLVPERL